MLISLEWLKQYVDVNENIEELDRALTMIGQEVEAIEVQGKYLDNVVIGHIVEYGRHPEADKLSLLKINVGEEEPIQIVCGAPNHKEGDKVVVARIGAVLPGDFKIKKSKIRGVESFGMCCSKAELGLGKDHSGIIILPEDAPVGMEYREYAGLNDTVFELEITPNRPDCLSHIGIAREIAAYYGREVKYPKIEKLQDVTLTDDTLDIAIEDTERCKRFAGRIIRGVKVGESPEWLKKRIMAMGLNPINNIVDISNFVMFEYNQPIHIYDLKEIAGGKIVARRGKAGEKLVTLMEQEIDVNDELVIADGEKPSGLAGIMGGLGSGIKDDTQDIFIEVAYFVPEFIRKAGRKFGIVSDAGYRNERGTDMENVPTVLDRVTDLVLQLADPQSVGKMVDVYPAKYESCEIILDIAKLRRFAGKDIEKERIIEILTNLNLQVTDLGETLKVVPPSYRGDLVRPADLYEEVIRMYGFENIEDKMPVEDISAGVKNEVIKLMDESKDALAKIGLQEVINYSFIPKEVKDMLHIDREEIMILNPIVETMSMMRPTLIYSILNNIKENLNRNQDSIKIFEVAKVFEKTNDLLAIEDIHMAIGVCGRDEKSLWNPKPEAYDFYTLKGYVEEYLEEIGIKGYKIVRTTNPNFHPGRAADIMIGRLCVGSFGEIHPEIAEKMDITRERAYIAEMNVSLLKQYMSKKIKYEKVVKYPEVTRDFAIVLDEKVLVGDMIEAIKKSSDFVESVGLFDIYRGEHIEAGKKSVAISIVMRNKNGTLNEEDITKVQNKILNIIRTKYSGEIRQ
ncbi:MULTISPECIES: phenylalanine--tRNA ligase subunit beta [Fusobacterium]|uniref:phenylalanine--tRNA ligase subunit beta n=1 Tax=Fusobacterium TaxID=848 RepID=UPI001F2D4FEE|nr:MULTISPECIES: phenylalanine--tRNA ligase subunit beta [Fusobacterium]MCF2611461.1 phenylalanine--tRNA ligase subunit beta [Fusobacterium perfoetens]MDY2980693.1 phenylalanine--tRNA ligase subunit beta [Fusobacterium sp.]